MDLKNARTALVYDRVNTPFGGAEEVLVALQELFPSAPLFTSVYDSNQAKWASGFDIRPSFLQGIPFAKNHHREFVSLMPFAFESLNLQDFDLIISISSAEGKGIITHPNQLHICYLLTPTRYLWSHHLEYENGILKPLKAFVFSKLRQWDFIAGQRPDKIISISKLTAKRTEKYYRRKVDAVIYPPFVPLTSPKRFDNNATDPYFLIVSRLVPYKNIDLAIKVCIKNKLKLKIIGNGPEKEILAELVENSNGKTYVEFLSNIPRQELTELYVNATAFLLPNEEDFGIAGLEALSVGCPVITSEKSGVGELVRHQQTGLLLQAINEETLTLAINQVRKIMGQKKDIAESVLEYNKPSFQKNFLKKIESLWKKHQETI